MKPFKTLVFATLLVFSLAFNTFAGEVEVPGAKPSPTPSLRITVTEEPLVVDPLMSGTNTEAGATTSEASDYLFYEALVALLSMY